MARGSKARSPVRDDPGPMGVWFQGQCGHRILLVDVTGAAPRLVFFCDCPSRRTDALGIYPNGCTNGSTPARGAYSPGAAAGARGGNQIAPPPPGGPAKGTAGGLAAERLVRGLEDVGHGVLAQHEVQDGSVLLVDDLELAGQGDGVLGFQGGDR